jgi:hypothetical protein
VSAGALTEAEASRPAARQTSESFDHRAPAGSAAAEGPEVGAADANAVGASEQARNSPRLPSWVKRTVPVLGSLAILAYYFHDYFRLDLENLCLDVGEKGIALGEAVRGADLVPAVAAIGIPQLVSWYFSALIAERSIVWFHGPFPLLKYFWVRGAMYILMFVNNVLGGGGLLLYQQRRGEVPWRKLLGILLFRVGVGMGWGAMWLLIPLTAAMQYFGYHEKARLDMTVWWAILLVPGLFWFVSSWSYWHLGRDPFGFTRLIVRNREDVFWTAFRRARPRHWLGVWLMSWPNMILTLVGFYFASLAFGVRVPFLEFIVVMPIAFGIMELPIALGGFGTATLAWMTFFGDHASEQSIAALTLFVPFCRSACRGLIGLVSLRPALADIATLFPSGGPSGSGDPYIDAGRP